MDRGENTAECSSFQAHPLWTDLYACSVATQGSETIILILIFVYSFCSSDYSHCR